MKAKKVFENIEFKRGGNDSAGKKFNVGNTFRIKEFLNFIAKPLLDKNDTAIYWTVNPYHNYDNRLDPWIEEFELFKTLYKNDKKYWDNYMQSIGIHILELDEHEDEDSIKFANINES